MSFDVTIRVKNKPKFELNVGVANITYNVKTLVEKSSGWEMKNGEQSYPIDKWARMITHGISELRANPAKYRKYEAKNGWGTVENILDFYLQCLEMHRKLVLYYNGLLGCAVVYVN